MTHPYKFCPHCAAPLELVTQLEDGGEKRRLRCIACGWPAKSYALITGFMEAGETLRQGIAREIKEETNLDASQLNLIGVYDFRRLNQVIIAYHAIAEGEVRLSPSWWITGCMLMTR